MRRFRYLLDPLCLLCCAGYLANRAVLKPHLHSAFLHGYFNDLLLIPCALPMVLWLQRQLDLRTNDDFPRFREVLFHLGIWTLLFEWVGPRLVRHATGDPLDILAYAIGGLVAFGWWTYRRRWRWAINQT